MIILNEITVNKFYKLFHSRFISSDINILKKSYFIYIHPKSKYNLPTWSPYLKKYLIHVENIQRKCTEKSFTAAIILILTTIKT